MNAIRVLVADNDASIRDVHRRLLESDSGMVWVGEAVTVDEAVKKTRDLQPHVVLMDIRFDNDNKDASPNGIDALRSIRSAGNEHIAVMVLTSYGSDDDLLDALVAGASGYIERGLLREDLLQHIRLAAEGYTVLNQDISNRVRTLLKRAPRRTLPECFRNLTPREREVVFAMLDGHISDKGLARHLDISPRTAQNHITEIMKKLDINDRRDIDRLARG
jgi:DNA-binding NarL/FixJ family response regulator